jgi:hypothetical protein
LFSILTLKKQHVSQPKNEIHDPIIKNQNQPTKSINNPKNVPINEAGSYRLKRILIILHICKYKQ